jgi:predicted 3-demethylubiquinone-9 3-methyltransferase (glyoxalase superfamily)
MHTQKITPYLWFDQNAEEAVQLYVSVFPNSRIADVWKRGDASFALYFELNGLSFTAFNAGPMFVPNPSISFYTSCESETEADLIWQKLSEGGKVLMPYAAYPWSKKYGWIEDRFGISWQITLGEKRSISPLLMFSDARQGQAKAAMNLYQTLFPNSSIGYLAEYLAGEPGPEGTVKHAQFFLDGQSFMAMDSPISHDFAFNEAISLLIHCEDQAEVDYFWEKLIANGGRASQCGWLVDPFGVSWQVVPSALLRLLRDSDPERAASAMQAMLKMKKIEIDKL